MTDSCASENSILVSPLFFFLPVHIFAGLWGAPAGTGMFKLLEKETGVKIGISEKTLRKYFVAPKVRKPSNSAKAKFERWLYHPEQPDSLKECMDGLESLTGKRTGEIEWKAMISSFKCGAKGRIYPETLEYIELLLDEESAYYQKAREQKFNPEQLLKMLYTEPFFNQYGLPVPESLLSEALIKSPEYPNDFLVQQPAVIQSLLHACVSLQMDILAHAEVEWFRDNLDQLSTEHHFRSLLSLILPKIEENEVISPVTLFFKMARDRLGFSSWLAIAEYMEVNGEADIESKRRKLMGWVNTEHLPKHQKAFDFLQRLIETKGNYSSLYYDDLYLAATFMDRLLRLFVPAAAHIKIPAREFLQAFSTYNEHFKRHKTAAIKQG